MKSEAENRTNDGEVKEELEWKSLVFLLPGKS